MLKWLKREWEKFIDPGSQYACRRCRDTGMVQKSMGPGSMGWKEECPTCKPLEGA